MKNKKIITILIATLFLFAITACSKEQSKNLITAEQQEKKIINLFGPMEKTNPDFDNVARSAFDVTIAMAEKELDFIVEYRTYTAENYQEKTYDDVCLDRARNNMDDWYLLNPDTIQILGSEGILADLSGIESAKN